MYKDARKSFSLVNLKQTLNMETIPRGEYKEKERDGNSILSINHFSTLCKSAVEAEQDNSDLCLPFYLVFLFQQKLPGEICVTQTGILDMLVLVNPPSYKYLLDIIL